MLYDTDFEIGQRKEKCRGYVKGMDESKQLKIDSNAKGGNMINKNGV